MKTITVKYVVEDSKWRELEMALHDTLQGCESYPNLHEMTIRKSTIPEEKWYWDKEDMKRASSIANR